MSRFSDLVGGKKEVAPAPAPVIEEAPRPEEEIADAIAETVNFHSMSKNELEDYGRTVGIELDRRHSKRKLIRELEEHLST